MPSATGPTIDCEEHWRVASRVNEKTKNGGERERRAGLPTGSGRIPPGLYKGEEGFHRVNTARWRRVLASLEMTGLSGLASLEMTADGHDVSCPYTSVGQKKIPATAGKPRYACLRQAGLG